MQLLWGIVVFSIGLVQTEDDVCDSAPNDAAKIMCMQLHQWDESARSARKKIALPPGLLGMIGTSIIADLAPIASSIYQCMDLTCLCTYFRVITTLR
uniref:Secreted protein n=1 Tax=Heterorhabditis bacteriophora TaxID=37862 RepID=A0A1I7WK44_HETBA